ncbi:MAG: hypothetical protein CSB28_00560 [Desulfobacterales bacterium]|nr:MAG: hypothetical protein CSB28_00560 [Desulfobacterales bacterium]
MLPLFRDFCIESTEQVFHYLDSTAARTARKPGGSLCLPDKAISFYLLEKRVCNVIEERHDLAFLKVVFYNQFVISIK